MGKSKQIGREENKKSIVDSIKSPLSQEKKERIQAKIIEMSDDDLEKLFENGKITQVEYEAILEYRKNKKKKKNEKQKFDERIRCNNTIIQKIIKLGKRFRRQEMEYEENLRENDKVLEKEERIRSRNDGQRQQERSKSRWRDGERGHSSGGRTRER